MSSPTATVTFVIPLLLLLLLTTATATTSRRQEYYYDTILKAKALVSQAKAWSAGTSAAAHNQYQTENPQQMMSNYPSKNVSVALGDCERLYDESEFRLKQLLSGGVGSTYTWEDVNAWLSGVLANHRSCSDSWGEGGGNGSVPFAGSGNLTSLISEAMAYSYMNMKAKTGARKGSAHRRPNPSEYEGLLASWNAATSKADLVVSKDGSGTHRTINEALAALGRMGSSRPSRAVIYVKSGVYNEKVEVEKSMRAVMFVGDGMDRTIVTGSRNVPDGSSTLSSATFGVSADEFWARDVTFENTAGPEKYQAVALRVSSDRSVFYRCSFKGYQDTLLAHSLRQFYRDCHVYGTVDFIFGDAAVVFQNCDILVRRPMSRQSNMVTAQGRDDPNSNTGILIYGCRIAPAPEFASVKGSFKSYLGRPWKRYSRTVILKTDLDGLIDPKGWTEWSGEFALSTLFYGEYMNTGGGASTERRVRWAGFHVLRSAEEAHPYSVSRFIQGESWIPKTGVPFALGL